MADKRFNFAVTAEDAASPVFSKVQQSLRSFEKPINSVQSDFRRLADSPGIGALSKSFDVMNKSALDAVASLGALVPSWGALAGIATGAGISQGAARWIESGRAINRASEMIGINIDRLQHWGYAMELAGGKREDMIAGLNEVGLKLRGALYEGHQDDFALAQSMGIKLEQGKPVDVDDAMMKIAKRFDEIRKKSGPQSAEAFLQQWGIDQLEPLFLKGETAIRSYLDEGHRYTTISKDAAKQTDELGTQLTRLSLAGEGLANRIFTLVAPALNEGAKATTKWLTETDKLTGAITAIPGQAYRKPEVRHAVVDAIVSPYGPGTSGIWNMAIKAFTDAAAFGADIGDSLMGKSSPKSVPTLYRPLAPWARQTPLIDTSPEDLRAAADRHPITVPDMAPTGKVDVRIRFENAPQGTRAIAQSTGDANARVETPMHVTP